jgi:hypothetical protein
MDFSNLNDSFHDLGENVQKYIQLRIEILKCVLTEALAKFAAMLLKIFIFSLLIFFIMFFLSFSFVFWYDQYVGPLYIGALIISGFYFLIGMIVFLLRKKIFLDPLVKKYSTIIFEAEQDEKD